MQIILLGPPGVGKGTQAKLLSAKYGIKHVSTGDILRAEVTKGSVLGNKAKTILERGKLVSDDIMIDIMKNVLTSEDCMNGFILDGFPRTIVQAEALEKLFDDLNIKINSVLYFEVDENEIVERLTNRYSCSRCSAIYNLDISKPSDAKCSKCGGELIQRDDDKPETVLHRLKVYKESTAPVKDFYGKNGKLHIVDGVGEVEEVFNKIITVLEE